MAFGGLRDDGEPGGNAGGDRQFEIPSLANALCAKGERPGYEAIEKGIVTEGAAEGAVHWEQCREGGGDYTDILSLKSPESHKEDSNDGDRADESIERSYFEAI